MLRTTGTGLLLLAVLACAPAHAQEAPAEEIVEDEPAPEEAVEDEPAPEEVAGDEGRRGRAGLEVGFFLGEDDADDTILIVVPRVAGRYELSPRIAVSLEWGLPVAKLGGGTRVSVGNPFLAGWYTLPVSELTVQIGAGLAMPLASISEDDALSAMAYQYALAMDGLMDAWLWAPENVGVVVPARVDHVLGSALRLGGEAAIALLIPTGEQSASPGNRLEGAEVEVFLQAAAEAAYVVGIFEAGVRLQAAWLATLGGDDFQLSVEPFVALDAGPAFARLRFTLNLDEPAGFSFDEQKVWGLHLGGGVVF